MPAWKGLNTKFFTSIQALSLCINDNVELWVTFP